ncbi:hypothetical protein LSH36_145g06020 [Paralvinella palmiformis]|uniref:Uncharacterized protein n=1 Tax=Paralvinella palmiformis TaxID=53620 RepID=A0AAD9JUV3_9ANNE|nr:hypothetical protein LSH36_145g06020 [Paralvinella palmiformis]
MASITCSVCTRSLQSALLMVVLLLSGTFTDDVAKCDAMCECQLISPNHITVHCARRDLPRIPADIPSDVTYLDVSYNRITALDGATIDVLERLKKLDLRNNLVSRVDGWTFQKLAALEELDLDNNLIQTVTPYMFSAASKLKILSLANNVITGIRHSAFIHLSLDSLNLRDNRKLTSLHSAAFNESGVNTLILDGCGIRDMDGDLLRPISGTLRVLSLSNMVDGLQLGSGALSSLNLDILQLVGNSMAPEALRFLAPGLKVKSLDLSLNKFARLDLAAMKRSHGTESLIVKKCHVREILDSESSSGAGGNRSRNLTGIRELDLSGNALTSFPVELFQWLPGLRNLNVADNPIGSMPDGAAGVLDRLESLDIANVSLTCGCPLRWFAEWRNVTKTLVVGDLCVTESRVEGGTARCSAPHQLTAWVESRSNNVTTFDIFCTASGNPAPRIRLATIQKVPDDNGSLLAVSGHGHLHFKANSRGCCGYSCTAVNNMGNDTITFHICPSGYHWTKPPDRGDDDDDDDDETGRDSIQVWILTIFLAVVLLTVLFTFGIICVIRMRRRGRFKSRLRKRREDEANPDETTGSHMVLMKSCRDEDDVINSSEFP